jgi:hypothetical protein
VKAATGAAVTYLPLSPSYRPGLTLKRQQALYPNALTRDYSGRFCPGPTLTLDLKPSLATPGENPIRPRF